MGPLLIVIFNIVFAIGKDAGLCTDHDPTRGSDHEWFKSHGSGRVGSDRIGSGGVRTLTDRA